MTAGQGLDVRDYQVFDPGTSGLLQDLPRSEAKAAFHRLMDARPVRREELRLLVGRYGVHLDGSASGVQDLNDWFLGNLEGTDQGLLPAWYSVVNDVALFLGGVIVSRCPHLQWTFYTASKRDLSYQRHVLTGFRAVGNPNYAFDIDWATATYAHRQVAGESVDPEQFSKWIRDCEMDA